MSTHELDQLKKLIAAGKVFVNLYTQSKIIGFEATGAYMSGGTLIIDTRLEGDDHA
jgi:hypothetical protein